MNVEGRNRSGRVSERDEDRKQEENASQFPWRSLRQWARHGLLKLWHGVKAAWQFLKAIPVHRRKMYMAVTGMVCLLLIAGTVLGFVIGSVGIGILFVTIVTLVWLAAIYFKGNSILPLLAGARLATEAERPELINMVRELSKTAGLPMPGLWIAENAEVNAFACGRDSVHAAIVVFTGGLSIWNEDETQGILAHEVAHIKNRDVLLDTLMRAILNGMQWSAIVFMKPIEWMVQFFAKFTSAHGQGFLANFSGFMVLCLSFLLRALDFTFGVVLLPATYLIQMAASRQQEYFADATGAQLTGSSQGLASALAKLHVMEQFALSASHVQGRRVHGMADQLWSTHPPPEERVQRLGGALLAAGSTEARKLLDQMVRTQDQTEEHTEEGIEEQKDTNLAGTSAQLGMAREVEQIVMRERGGEVDYKVVPVNLDVLAEQGSQGAARQVQTIINQEVSRGWEFISLENIEIVVTDPGNKGCFGLGATPQTNRVTRFDMAVFRK